MPPKRKSRKRGKGFFDAIGDAFKAIPTAFRTIPQGIEGAANNPGEITGRWNSLADKINYIGGVIPGAPKIPKIGGRRRKRK